MNSNIVRTALFFICLGACSALLAQNPEGGIKPTVIQGDVASITDKAITINTKDGPVEAALGASTVFKRVLPGNPSLKDAAASALTDIGVGDKVVASCLPSAADKKVLVARTVYLMTKADISQLHTKEAEAWKTRGITGKVTKVNPDTNQVTIEVRNLMNTQTVVLTPKSDAVFRRYAPDSIKYEDAKASSIGETKPGDQIRALGDKSSDGTSFAAEEVLTGAFQTVAGTVKSVDVDKKEIVISDFTTKKDVTVQLSTALFLKRFPADMAERMAGAQGGGMRPPGQGGGAPAGPPRDPGQGQGSQGQNPGGGRQGFGGRGGGGNIDDMLDRFPNITVADLKAGEMIALSSAKDGTPDRVKAIKFLAGVEPFLRTAQAGPGRGGRTQGIEGGISIPGLDGMGFP